MFPVTHQGEDATELKYFRAAFMKVAGVRSLVSRTGYTGEDGVELYIPAAEGWGGLRLPRRSQTPLRLRCDPPHPGRAQGRREPHRRAGHRETPRRAGRSHARRRLRAGDHRGHHGDRRTLHTHRQLRGPRRDARRLLRRRATSSSPPSRRAASSSASSAPSARRARRSDASSWPRSCSSPSPPACWAPPSASRARSAGTSSTALPRGHRAPPRAPARRDRHGLGHPHRADPRFRHAHDRPHREDAPPRAARERRLNGPASDLQSIPCSPPTKPSTSPRR